MEWALKFLSPTFKIWAQASLEPHKFTNQAFFKARLNKKRYVLLKQVSGCYFELRKPLKEFPNIRNNFFMFKAKIWLILALTLKKLGRAWAFYLFNKNLTKGSGLQARV